MLFCKVWQFYNNINYTKPTEQVHILRRVHIHLGRSILFKMSEEDKIEDFGGVDESPKRGKMGKVHIHII